MVSIIGFEAWKISIIEEKRLDRFYFMCLRKILGIWWLCVRNKIIFEIIGVIKISDEI